MKKQIRKMRVEVLSIAVLMIAALSGASVYAQQVQTFSRGYQFGPGTGNPTGSTISLRVPARTTIINVNTTIRRDPGPGAAAINNIPLRVEFKNPQNGDAAGPQFPSAGVVQIALPDFVNPLGTFRSQKGCNDTWKVNIKTQNGLAPAARVWGTVTFVVMNPFRVDLDMVGSSPTLNPGANFVRNLSGHELASSNADLITGPGLFRIRAKWDTDLTDIFHLGNKVMNVALIRPNGSIANSQSALASNINFTYTATQADANQSGSWEVRATNQGNGRTVNFDIENWPLFNSTFQGVCSGGSSISGS